jgi:hypothetical protein
MTHQPVVDVNTAGPYEGSVTVLGQNMHARPHEAPECLLCAKMSDRKVSVCHFNLAVTTSLLLRQPQGPSHGTPTQGS